MFTPNSIESLKGIQKWGKFVGYVTIVLGAISTLFGLFFFIIGAAPGVFTILFGVYLVNSAKSAEALIPEYNEHHMNEFLLNMKKYLKLQGIFYIIYLAFMLLIIIGYIFFFTLLVSSI